MKYLSETIDFSTITAAEIENATQSSLKQAQNMLEEIYACQNKALSFENVVQKIDDIYAYLETFSGRIFLMGYTHPAQSIRDAAQKSIADFEKFDNQLIVDEKLYRVVKAYTEKNKTIALPAYQQKFVEELIRDFERNGLHLPEKERKKLKAIRDEMAETGILFNKNISDYDDFLIVNETEIQGLSDDYKATHRTIDGTYKIDLSYPSYRPFMKYSESGSKRKELLIKFLNRAAPDNLPVLKKLLRLRAEMADLLNYNTFASYNLVDKMAKTPEAVWAFEQELQEKVRPKAESDYEKLLEIKRCHLNAPNEKELHQWEAAFYTQKLLKEHYEVDEEKVKEYFPLDTVLKGLFSINKTLFNVDFEEVESPKVWHSSVRKFVVKRRNTPLASFYLDLFPRENKYKHAAMFPLISRRKMADGFRRPQAALVCNFPPPTTQKPSLLPHSEVETLFHEFGHLMHHLLSEAELTAQSGTSVSRDFVETPSQLFEKWVWNYDALRLFARHYETQETLPKALFDKMYAAKNVGIGLHTLQQIFYGTLDMTFHDRTKAAPAENTTEVVKRLQNSLLLYPYIENTHFEASFGHLYGYAAGYYGYLWAEVYAEDIFSVFKEKGILNPETGQHYLETILSQGSSQDEMQQIKNFLQREPDQAAFLKAIGLK